jgi:hypothetical protein
MTYIAPKVFEKKFTCPHCGAISLQRWTYRNWDLNYYSNSTDDNPIRAAKCDHCEEYSLWLEETMLYPDIGCAPQPNPDLPESVTEIYLEAASISTKSPRGAAALLRLAVQILCKELGEKGENINEDIAGLVKKGLPERVQQALDIVRVTGNKAVHPGQVDVDDADVVANLFELINVIAEYTISMPQRINGLYGGLPETAIDQIKKRDKKT